MIQNLKIKQNNEEWVRHSFFDGYYMYSFTYEIPTLFNNEKLTGRIQSLKELNEKDIIELIYKKHEFDNKQEKN